MKDNKPARSFEDLQVWQKAHAMVLEIYKITQAFPKEGVYGLTAQFRRAAISVPSNIAEGFVKRGVADKLRFYNLSQGSLEECRYYVILSRDLGFRSSKALSELVDEVSRMLNVYISKIKQ